MLHKDSNLEELVQQATKGNKQALEEILISIQGYVFNLAVRFFYHLPDAQDACQEVLIKVMTNLSKFEGRSSFKTWVYRVTTNHLLNSKKTAYENLTFEEGLKHLAIGMEYPDYQGADSTLLEEEVKLHCTTSMLLCLSRPLRLAYLVGEIFEFNGVVSAQILDIPPATFRKRLSLARNRIRTFMAGNCGLYNPDNPCRCRKQINYSIEVEWFDPLRPTFMNQKLSHMKDEIDSMVNEVAIFHSHPTYRVPEEVFNEVKTLIDSNRFKFLA